MGSAYVWAVTGGHHFRAAGPVGEFVAGIIAAIALASGSYFLVGRPFLALKRRFEPTPSPTPRTPQQSPAGATAAAGNG